MPVFGLLVLSVWINYIDRGTLGVAAPTLAPELNLSATQMGYLLSAFFWTYSICLFISGWMVDRVNVVRFYAAGFLVWSIATLATGYTSGFVSILWLRMLLGIGESVSFPAYSRIITAGFPEHKRGFANAMVDVGTKAGPALGTFAGGMLVARFGWRGMFIAVGIASVLWLIPWLATAPSDLMSGGVSSSRGPSLVEIASKRQAWATFLGLFFYNYAFFFLITWLPSYLVNQRHYSMKTMAVAGALPFIATAISSLSAGMVTDRLIAKGIPVWKVRQRTAVLGLLIAGFTLPGSTALNENVGMFFLLVASVGIGIFTSNLWAITQTLSGPLAAGRWTGLQNGIGNMGSLSAPIITGWSVDLLGSFNVAFLIASGALLISAALFTLMLGKVEPIVWKGKL